MPESCFQPVQDSTLDHFKSSSPTESPPCSIHVNSPDSDTNLEIVDELRKAQARVRFLKKKLRRRGVSNLLKQTSRKQHLLSKSPREKLMLRRKDDISEQEDLQECVQGSIHSEMATHDENQESKTCMKIGLVRQEEEESTDKIFKMKNSETSQGSMDLLNHVIAPSSNMWDCKQCILQGGCSNECSSMEGLVSESSTHFQDLEGYLFGQKFQTDDPFSSKRHILIDVSSPIYSQSTAATALVKPGNELSYLHSGTGCFKCSFEQDFSDVRFSEQGLLDSNLVAESVLHEVDLLLHQNTAAECNDLVSKPIDVHEHLGCQHFSLQTSGELSAETQVRQSSFIQHNYHEADLLGSESKQIMEHQDSAEKSSKLCESDLLLHHLPSASVTHSRYVAAGFEYECARAEHYSVQTSAGGFYGGGCTSREETWKQEPFDEQRLMEADNLWAEDQFVLQNETFSLDRFDFTS